MKIVKKKLRKQTPLVNPIIVERLLEKVLKKGEYIAIKCHNSPGDNDSGSHEINLPCYGGGEDHLKSGLSGKINYSRPQMAKASVQDLYCTRQLNDY